MSDIIRNFTPRVLGPSLLVAGTLVAFGAGAAAPGTPAGTAGADRSATAVSPAARTAGSPDVAVAPDGTVYVLWVDRGGATPAAPDAHAGHAGHAGPRSHDSSVDVMLASSRDGGRSFGPPVRVNARAGQVWSFPTARPKLALAPNGTLHVLYTGNEVNAAGRPVIVPMYTRSTDGGRNFEESRRLATLPEADLGEIIHGGFAQAQTFGTVLADRAGGVHVYWIDTRFMAGGGDTGALLAVHSDDDGASFGPERVLGRAGACPCCQLAATLGEGRTVYLGMRHVEEGQRDSWVYRSDDHGLSFAQAARLGDMRWKIDGCPLKPTVVAAHGARVYAAAFNAATEQTGVRFAVSDDGGRTFSPFDLLHPAAAVSDSPAVVALRGTAMRAFWHAKAGDDPGRAIYSVYSADGGRSLGPVERLVSGSAVGYPAAAALVNGDAGLVYVAADRIWFRSVPGTPQQKRVQR